MTKLIHTNLLRKYHNFPSYFTLSIILKGVKNDN